MKKLAASLFFAVLASAASAVIIDINLEGKAGIGLLPGNENGTVSGTPGTGGEIGGGITFDDATNTLAINVGWGTGQGFTDLSAAPSAAHIHGITASNATASFFENAAAIITLTIVGTASNGYITQNTVLTSPQVTALYNGQLYINVHTSTNPGGEIRGQLMAVPEPSTYAALLGLAALGWAARHRRRAL